MTDHKLDIADESEAKAIYRECMNLNDLIERLEMRKTVSESDQNLNMVTRQIEKVAHSLKQLIGVSFKIAILEPDVFLSPLPTGRVTVDLTSYYENQVLSLSAKGSGTCVECSNAVHGHCFRVKERSWHVRCLSCNRCCDDEPSELSGLLQRCLFCGNHCGARSVTSRSQSRHLFWVGLARLMKYL